MPIAQAQMTNKSPGIKSQHAPLGTGSWSFIGHLGIWALGFRAPQRLLFATAPTTPYNNRTMAKKDVRFPGGYLYQVQNRAGGKKFPFMRDADFLFFENTMAELVQQFRAARTR